MATRVFIPANDDNPTEAWLGFVGTEEFFWATEFAPNLLWQIKTRGYDISEKKWSSERREYQREKTVSNFIWYLRFEYSFIRSEEEPQKPELTEV